MTSQVIMAIAMLCGTKALCHDWYVRCLDCTDNIRQCISIKALKEEGDQCSNYSPYQNSRDLCYREMHKGCNEFKKNWEWHK